MTHSLQDHRLLVLDACKRLPGDSSGYVLDSEIADDVGLRIDEVRDSILSLQTDKFVGMVRLVNPDRLKAVITPDGRLALSQSRPFPVEEDDGHSKVKGSIKIVPKGLRAFDEHDANFFLELLPGPRRDDGLPESIYFWKVRIEETDPDKTFKVGIIYGPSGCGKSSLVKAGLLSRLSPIVLPIYVESTATDTESTLLQKIKKSLLSLPTVTDLPNSLDLRTTLIAAKQQIGKENRKLLLVIDQFEQWLHSNRGKENTELAEALRECDGKRIQAIVMVRDDFSMALFRFLEVLGIDFKRGENAYVVHRFDLPHARKVLMAFGTAYGRLPETDEELTQDQQGFLNHTLKGLSQDGEVVPVRLALFAEILGELIGGRPWTPATLDEVGGTEGVGVTFLEKTFNSPKDYPRFYVHQKAAQAVLKALLPESASTVRGHIRSHEELQSASGYSADLKSFGHLLSILDQETHLITPVESGDLGETTGQLTEKNYQLTHDYLVHSLRDWLTRKQQETSEGRAELLLEELMFHWDKRKGGARDDYAYFPRMQELVTILSSLELEKLDERKLELLVASFRHYWYDLGGVMLSSILDRFLKPWSIYTQFSSVLVGVSLGLYLLKRMSSQPNTYWYYGFIVFIVAYPISVVLISALPFYIRSLRLPIIPRFAIRYVTQLIGRKKFLLSINRLMLVFNTHD